MPAGDQRPGEQSGSALRRARRIRGAMPLTSIDLRDRHQNDFKQCYWSRSSRRSLIARQNPVPIGAHSVVPGNSGVASETRVRTKLPASSARLLQVRARGGYGPPRNDRYAFEEEQWSHL